MGIIDNIIEIGKKFLPDKNAQLEYEIEMRKLDISEFQEKKGVITRAFHLVFPLSVLTLLGFYIAEFVVKINYFLENDVWLLQNFTPKGLELIVIIFLSILMPKKIVDAIVPVVVKYIENKFRK